MTMDTFRIDEIARRLLESVPPALRTVQKDLETNFRAVLRSSLAKLDVVTRDEFDTQTRVLQRTREKLEQLEARLRELEGRSGPGGAAHEGAVSGGGAAPGGGAGSDASGPGGGTGASGSQGH
jgi:ubiquinone biosynthesis accessory factor UbiK